MFHNRFFLSICYSTYDLFILQTALLYYLQWSAFNDKQYKSNFKQLRLNSG